MYSVLTGTGGASVQILNGTGGAGLQIFTGTGGAGVQILTGTGGAGVQNVSGSEAPCLPWLLDCSGPQPPSSVEHPYHSYKYIDR